MPLRPEELAKTIELTLIEQGIGDGTLEHACAQAHEHHFASVCVGPDAVSRARDALRGTDVKVAAAVGFPHGGQSTKEKVATAAESVDAGAGELDLVLNGEALAAGEFLLVRDELVALVHSVRMRTVNAGRGYVLLKAVFDPTPLSDKAKRLLCRIIEAAGVDFASIASDGDGAGTPHEVELLRDYLSERVAVKASGAADSAGDVIELVNAGAGRIGTPYAVRVMQELATYRTA